MKRLLLICMCWLGTACGQDTLMGMPAVQAGSDAPGAAPMPPNQGFGPDESHPTEEEEPVPQDMPPEDDCEGTSDLVYVIDQDSASLFLFDPVGGAFTLHGALDCGAGGSEPASMSVARNGVAYIRYSNQVVYAVDLETMACEATAYSAAFGPFGMGFATVEADSWMDDLYVANAFQLARLNTESWALNPIGTLPSQSELSGNSAGELWAILPLERPAQLIHLEKTTGRVLDSILMPSFPPPIDIDTFAFATWGGDFWVFVRRYGLGQSTDVYRVTSEGGFTLVRSSSGLNVVGAGVSTCAPSE